MSDYSKPIRTGKMQSIIGTPEDAIAFLNDPHWIVFNVDDLNFMAFLEENVFCPNTPENAEFEILIGTIDTIYGPKMANWFRFFDTKKNRAAFSDAMCLYYKKPLPSDWERGVEKIRASIGNTIKIINGRLTLTQQKTTEEHQ
jgi:hypothetical protein